MPKFRGKGVRELYNQEVMRHAKGDVDAADSQVIILQHVHSIY